MSPFGPKGIEDVKFHPLRSTPAGLNTFTGGGNIDSVMGSIIPVLVMNRDTGVITERPMLETLYFASMSVVGNVAGFFPIWDFEPEAPDPTAEFILLKIASGIIDIVAAKLAPPVALLARALDRSAAIAEGGVGSLSVIRGIFIEGGGVGWMLTVQGVKVGIGNAGGARIGWPRFASSSHGFGIGELSAQARLSMGTNQVVNVYPFVDDTDGFSRIYEGIWSGVGSGATQDMFASLWMTPAIFPLVMTPGEVMSISPALDPSTPLNQTPPWPIPGGVTLVWSEFTV